MLLRPLPDLGAWRFVGLALTVALHAAVFVLVGPRLTVPADRPIRSTSDLTILMLDLRSAEDVAPESAPVTVMRPAPGPVPEVRLPPEPATPRVPASMQAPPAPTAEEWAFASSYKLKNSKGYRYTWGQQVRSMMGTAVEGPDQGLVRFRVEISPDGSLARLDTLWSTSEAAERLARQAIGRMPRWPATPTGQPLVFEKTISFSPFVVDGPPLYKDDCLPDPPVFTNPFAWDGRSTPAPAPVRRSEPAGDPDPQSLEECLRQLPRDSIEAEQARDQRLMDQWGSAHQRR